MRNIAETQAYTLFDHVFVHTVRALSSVVGLKRVTQPFWNRWFASGVDEDVILQFLDEVGTIDNWAATAEAVIARKVADYDRDQSAMPPAERITALRKLSYLGHMAQWGCLPITPQRVALYQLARDRYCEAEVLAFGSAYRRHAFAWRGATYHGNLHLQPAPSPLIVIVHGIDGCKEEHLSTELALHAAGFSTLCLDGPGQGEALLIDGLLWSAEFFRFLSAAIDQLAGQAGIDTARVGLLGISIGGMWCYQAAAHDPRITAIFDLGAPLHTRKFPSLPFLIKTRLCQVTGARTEPEIAQVLAQNNIEDPALLGAVSAHVRMVHGERDRVVSTADKQHLMAAFQSALHDSEASLRIIEGGDHCCTGHYDAVRDDAVAFFSRVLPPRA
jgi:alpha-beta hydrolase superfamily lysophospholipase